MRKFGLVLGWLCLTASSAVAQGCPAKKGEDFPGIEAMNQNLLDADYTAFAAAVASGSGGGISMDLTSIAQVFPNGFDHCTTIVQRREATGMTQHIVVFRAGKDPLFAYWRVLPVKSSYTLSAISLNSDLKTILNLLK